MTRAHPLNTQLLWCWLDVQMNVKRFRLFFVLLAVAIAVFFSVSLDAKNFSSLSSISLLPATFHVDGVLLLLLLLLQRKSSKNKLCLFPFCYSVFVCLLPLFYRSNLSALFFKCSVSCCTTNRDALCRRCLAHFNIVILFDHELTENNCYKSNSDGFYGVCMLCTHRHRAVILSSAVERARAHVKLN